MAKRNRVASPKRGYDGLEKPSVGMTGWKPQKGTVGMTTTDALMTQLRGLMDLAAFVELNVEDSDQSDRAMAIREGLETLLERLEEV